MKAKRLLSAFLTVAMMLTTLVTLGTVAYAGDDTTESIVPYLDIAIDEISEEDIDTYGFTLEEGQNAYMLTVKLSDYGTLTTAAKNVNTGTKLQSVFVGFQVENVAELIDFTDEAVEAGFMAGIDGIMAEDVTAANETGTTDKFNVFTTYSTAAACYPKKSNTAKEVTEELLIFQVPFRTKKGVSSFDLTVYDARIAITAIATNKLGDYTSYDTPKKTLTLSGTKFTVGSSTPVVADPVIRDVVVNGTDGVAIIGQDTVKYDNALSVTASFENVSSITGAGVLFIPSTVLGNNTLTAETTNVANAYKLGAGGGDGKLTIKAAIKDIPRALQGTDIQFVTRPYILKDTAYTYGTQATTTVNFGNTGEIAD